MALLLPRDKAGNVGGTAVFIVRPAFVAADHLQTRDKLPQLPGLQMKTVFSGFLS